MASPEVGYESSRSSELQSDCHMGEILRRPTHPYCQQCLTFTRPLYMVVNAVISVRPACSSAWTGSRDTCQVPIERSVSSELFL
jgi:hypothetical protein